MFQCDQGHQLFIVVFSPLLVFCFLNDTTERIFLTSHVAGKHHNPSVLDVLGGVEGVGGGGGAAGEKDGLFSHLRKT